MPEEANIIVILNSPTELLLKTTMQFYDHRGESVQSVEAVLAKDTSRWTITTRTVMSADFSAPDVIQASLDLWIPVSTLVEHIDTLDETESK